MSDLISRQAAIDVIAKWLKDVFGIKSEDNLTVFKRLRALLSAEPEQPEIVRCKDCKYLLPKGSFCSKDMCCLRGMAHYHNVDIHNDFCSWAERQEE